MRVSTILFIIALILSTGDLIASTTNHEIISNICRSIAWSCLGAGWTLLFLGY